MKKARKKGKASPMRFTTCQGKVYVDIRHIPTSDWACMTWDGGVPFVAFDGRTHIELDAAIAWYVKESGQRRNDGPDYIPELLHHMNRWKQKFANGELGPV